MVALPVEFLDDLEMGVEEHHDTGETVGLGEDEKHQADNGERAGNSAVAPLQPGDKEDQRRSGAQHDGGA